MFKFSCNVKRQRHLYQQECHCLFIQFLILAFLSLICVGRTSVVSMVKSFVLVTTVLVTEITGLAIIFFGFTCVLS